MNTFKEALALEAREVFCNPDEFAEATPITLNGVACDAVVSGPKTETVESGDGRPAVLLEMAVIHFPSGLIPLPKASKAVDWNGEKWFVAHSANNCGLFRIELYREKS